MQVVSYTQARKSLEAVIDQVIENQEPALIRRREGGNVVLLPEQTYNSMQETLHLFSTTANGQRLLRSVDQLNAGNTIPNESRISDLSAPQNYHLFKTAS